jgi:hypothetical protein
MPPPPVLNHPSTISTPHTPPLKPATPVIVAAVDSVSVTSAPIAEPATPSVSVPSAPLPPAADQPTATPVATSTASDGGSGTVPPVSATATSATSAPPPPPKKRSFFGRVARWLLVLAGLGFGGVAGVLALLKNNVDYRDYCDVHAPQQMKELRDQLPGFLPPPSQRALIGRVGVKFGFVDTVQTDVDKAVAAADRKLEEKIEPARDVVSSKVLPVLNGQAPLPTQKEMDEEAAKIAAAVKAAELQRAAEQARLRELAGAKAPAPSPAAPAPMLTVPEPVQAAAQRVMTVVNEVASNAAETTRSLLPAPAPLDPDAAELAEALQQLADAEAAVAPWTAEQQKGLWEAVSSVETAMKERALARMSSLEAHQKHTLDRLAQQQSHELIRAHERARAPQRDFFSRQLRFEEENKWRAKLYTALETQNDSMSEVADQALQRVEAQLRQHYREEIQRLERMARDTLADTIQPLQAQLDTHLHQQLRSAQAHKLSAALLVLQELLQRDQASLAEPWRVVQDISATDYTLRQAVQHVDASTVARGVYTLHALKQTFFQLLAPELKVSTFMPEQPERTSVLRKIMARIFAALTLSEAGDVVLPVKVRNKQCMQSDVATQRDSWCCLYCASM